MTYIKYISLVVFSFLFLELASQTGPKTKIRLYKQTTDLDSLNLSFKNPCWLDINQPAHGFVMEGALSNKPFLGYINGSGRINRAKSDSIQNRGYGIVYVLDNNNLRYYVCDNVINSIAHGYPDGDILNQQVNGELATDTGQFIQEVYEIIERDNSQFLKFPVVTLRDSSNVLSYQQGTFYMGAPSIPNVIPKITSGLNFGSGGTYDNILGLTVDIASPAINAALLAQYDIVVFSYLADGTLSVAERNAIKNWVDNDRGKLVVYADNNTHDDLAVTFGISANNPSTNNWINDPVQVTHPLFQGPFGTITTFNAAANRGFLNLNGTFTALAQDNANAARKTIARYNSGAAVFIANEAVQRTNVSAGAAVTSANDVLICNLFAFILDL